MLLAKERKFLEFRFYKELLLAYNGEKYLCWPMLWIPSRGTSLCETKSPLILAV